MNIWKVPIRCVLEFLASMSSTLFSCNYPLYTVGRLNDNNTEFYVAGGGGQAKTGVPNSLDVYKLGYDGGVCVSVPVHHHDMETSVIMNSAAHPKKPYCLAVGVGGECCAIQIRKEDKSSKGKGQKVKRRKKSQTSDDEDKPNSTGQSSRIVIKSARVQTDFSEEPYQRVVSFTCDGGRVVTGGGDGVVRVWEYPSLEKICEFKGHKNEIEDISCHSSEKQVVVSVCRNGQAVVWDLGSREKEHSFSWSPGQPVNTAAEEKSDKKPLYRFRACCFSPKVEGQDHSSLYTLNIPIRWSAKQKKCCYLLKWDAGAWIVEEERRTGKELLSSLAVEDSGRYVGVGTGEGSVLIYSSDLKLLSKVSGVHTVFVTGLAFIPMETITKPVNPAGKQVSKPDRLALISVSADRTCSATPVKRTTRSFTFIILFFIIPLIILAVAVVTKLQQLW